MPLMCCRRAPRRQALSYSYPRDWDTDWPRTQAHAQRRARRREDWELGDPVPQYHYPYQADSPPLRPRMSVVHPTPARTPETRTVWYSQQRGSVVVPYKGASVRVGPQPETSKVSGVGARTFLYEEILIEFYKSF